MTPPRDILFSARIAAAAGVLAACTLAVRADEPPASGAGSGGSVESTIGWGRGRTISPIIRPTRPPLMAENTFVPPTAGRLVIGGTGERYFVFDRASSGARLPAVVLLPSLELGALERLATQTGAATSDTSTRLLISGQVFVYRGRNYMLMAAPPLLERTQIPVHPEPTAATTSDVSTAVQSPRASDSGTGASDPDVADIIADLEREAGPRRALSTAAPENGASGGGSPMAVPAATVSGETTTATAAASGELRSVAPLALRRGRLIRGPQGSWLYTLDNGPGNPTEPPLTILPCMNLQAMEASAERLGESATFVLSGEVSSYQGKNYVLPRLFFAERTSANLTPVQ